MNTIQIFLIITSILNNFLLIIITYYLANRNCLECKKEKEYKRIFKDWCSDCTKLRKMKYCQL